MYTNIEERACDLAVYIIENRATVRAAAKQFNVSKSTVHKDLTERLKTVNPALYHQVRELLVASLCGLIRAYGGFESILAFIRRVFRGKRGGQIGIGLLVGLMDIATANNTVAIVMAGPIAKEVAEEYGISPKRSASLLDTFSCIFQGIIPYGAQMLVALSTCATLGYAVSAFDIIPLLFYPFLLCLSSLLFILFDHQ